ncbi:hypothetical protein [Sulfurimonas sp.]|uniref:hypothetical protein n=1 Tax=Sulfurimonas sp. TaxID=2022749 RepID=UPI0025F969ED|nr:hypothetical protein [Sulfurimonas sp.]MDD5157609.1 hypothetical protein [Sulfurimonas sp.]
MVQETIIIQDIIANDFLTIFISSSLVLVFGGFYVGIYTAVKVGLLKKWAMLFAYIFWILTDYCLYLMGSLMHVNDFTGKALVMAAIGLLLLPHAVYHMQNRVHEENEH